MHKWDYHVPKPLQIPCAFGVSMFALQGVTGDEVCNIRVKLSSS